jgi:septal ring factor EnvC (AmiA/AmiB activator)
VNGEELERAIDFLLKSQANLDTRIALTNEQLARTDEQLARTDEQLARTDEQLARTDEQLRQTNQQLKEFADTQAAIMQVMTRTLEAQAEFNARHEASLQVMTRAVEAQTETNARHSAFEVRQERLNEEHERWHKTFRAAMTDLAAAQARTEETVSRLADRADGPPPGRGGEAG